ncbi:hypothetical protein QFC21_007139 [Naganishia friedmannii]|uniref:Uncharacterized protein n=1 Tax=Naganishia friedmannii TaxID=89922 RepID=A0ACC2UY35_9TREE|nr:hypothetical protein QFC21_007139 [Naganishia friedmannii]
MDGEKTVIRPRLKDLAEGDVHLANLSAYAKLLVSVEDRERAAHNAGLLYLTIIDAFQQIGITNVQWSPNLILEIGSREYEIDIHDQQQVKGDSSMIDAPVLMSVDTRHFTQSGLEPSVTESPGSSGTSSPPSVTQTPAIAIINPLSTKRSNKLTSFVVALNNRDYTGSYIDPKGEWKDTPTVSALVPVMNASPLGCEIAHSKGTELEGLGCSSDAAIRCVNRCFRQLDMLDAGMASLSVKTNWAYWQLGKAYEAFCKFNIANTKDRDWNHRSEQQRLFALLCKQIESVLDHGSGSSDTRRSALQKRLQRARKFLLLVDTFGMSVLNSVPEVSVSRVDVLRMEELRSLADGLCMEKEVESIRHKLDSSSCRSGSLTSKADLIVEMEAIKL